MPIKPEYRKHYGKEWREVIRPMILRRAGYCCEQCSAPDRKAVVRVGGMWKLIGRAQPWHTADGSLTTEPPAESHLVEIVLTIAHLNHTPGDDRPENLKALCSWCHLNLDMSHHKETRATRKDLTRPLLQEPQDARI